MWTTSATHPLPSPPAPTAAPWPPAPAPLGPLRHRAAAPAPPAPRLHRAIGARRRLLRRRSAPLRRSRRRTGRRGSRRPGRAPGWPWPPASPAPRPDGQSRTRPTSAANAAGASSAARSIRHAAARGRRGGVAVSVAVRRGPAGPGSARVRGPACAPASAWSVDRFASVAGLEFAARLRSVPLRRSCVSADPCGRVGLPGCVRRAPRWLAPGGLSPPARSRSARRTCAPVLAASSAGTGGNTSVGGSSSRPW